MVRITGTEEGFETVRQVRTEAEFPGERMMEAWNAVMTVAIQHDKALNEGTFVDAQLLGKCFELLLGHSKYGGVAIVECSVKIKEDRADHADVILHGSTV